MPSSDELMLSTTILTLGLKTTVEKLLEVHFFGCVFAGIGTGVVLIQALQYYRAFRHDKWFFKVVAGSLVLLVVAIQVLICVAFMNIAYNLQTFDRALRYDAISNFAVWQLMAIICAITQSFYAHRLYVLLGHSKVFAAVTVPAILASLISACVCCVHGFRIPASRPVTLDEAFALKPWLEHERAIGLVFTSITLATDLGLSLTMVVALLRSRTGLPNDSLLLIVARICLESMIPAAMSMTAFVVLLATYGTMAKWDRVPSYMTAPLYAQAVLHSLLARQDLRRQLAASSQQLQDDAEGYVGGGGLGGGGRGHGQTTFTSMYPLSQSKLATMLDDTMVITYNETPHSASTYSPQQHVGNQTVSWREIEVEQQQPRMGSLSPGR